MNRPLVGILLGLSLALFAASSVHAESDCRFVLGFNTLRDLIGHEVVGACLESERYNHIGDSVQQTTGGLLVWRKADNRTAFTDGYRTWLNGPNGLEQRLNTERFDWEDGLAFRTALETLQTTTSGQTLYDQLLEAGPGLSFDKLPVGWNSHYFDHPRHELVSNQDLRNASADVIAALITYETVLAINAKRNGPQDVRWHSGADCLDEAVAANMVLGQWWYERFGEEGLRDVKTVLEAQLNREARDFREQTLAAKVPFSRSLRRFCAEFGALPPLPPPIPVAERPVAPLIEEALLELRSTESGEVLYADYVASHIAYLGFAELGGGDRITAWLADDGLHYEVFFDEVFREASPFARTVALVDVLYVLRPSGNSEIETREQCFEYYVLQSGARAKWWHEKFGAVGKLDPTARERNENENMWLWLTESLGEWVRLSERYQLTCAQYDD